MFDILTFNQIESQRKLYVVGANRFGALPVGINLNTRQRGFTLIEIMVALALTSVLVFGLVELFVATTKNARAATSVMEIQENGRTALQLIANDVRRLGYFASLLDITAVTGTAGVADVSAAPCAAADTTWGRGLAQPLFGLDDPTNINTVYPCIATAEYSEGDVLVVRYTPSVPVATTAMVAGRPYLRTGLRSNRGALFVGSDQGNAANDVSIPWRVVSIKRSDGTKGTNWFLPFRFLLTRNAARTTVDSSRWVMEPWTRGHRAG